MPDCNLKFYGLEALERVLRDDLLQTLPVQSGQGAQKSNFQGNGLQLRRVYVGDEAVHPRHLRVQSDGAPERERPKRRTTC